MRVCFRMVPAMYIEDFKAQITMCLRGSFLSKRSLTNHTMNYNLDVLESIPGLLTDMNLIRGKFCIVFMKKNKNASLF